MLLSVSCSQSKTAESQVTCHFSFKSSAKLFQQLTALIGFSDIGYIVLIVYCDIVIEYVYVIEIVVCEVGGGLFCGLY